jgi:hypothetical protein
MEAGVGVRETQTRAQMQCVWETMEHVQGAAAELDAAFSTWPDTCAKKPEETETFAALTRAAAMCIAELEQDLTHLEKVLLAADAELLEPTRVRARAQILVHALAFASARWTSGESVGHAAMLGALCTLSQQAAVPDIRAISLGVVLFGGLFDDKDDADGVLNSTFEQLVLNAIVSSLDDALACLECLLACRVGARAAGRPNAGGTALTMAAAYGNARAVRVLLACKEVVATVHAVNSDGQNALMQASDWKNCILVPRYSDTVLALLECACVAQSVDRALDRQGRSAFDIACQTGAPEDIVNALWTASKKAQGAGEAAGKP